MTLMGMKKPCVTNIADGSPAKGHLSLKRHANLIALLLPPKPAAKIVELTDLLYSGHHG